MNLLRQKISQLEEEKQVRTALAVERDEANLTIRKLHKKAERLQKELDLARESNTDLKAKLSETSELKVKYNDTFHQRLTKEKAYQCRTGKPICFRKKKFNNVKISLIFQNLSCVFKKCIILFKRFQVNMMACKIPNMLTFLLVMMAKI